jgi:hypothetical protein
MNQVASGIAKLKRRLRIMFVVVVINNLLWAATYGVTLFLNGQNKPAGVLAFIGFAFAVIALFWAHSAVYQRAKQLEPQP